MFGKKIKFRYKQYKDFRKMKTMSLFFVLAVSMGWGNAAIAQGNDAGLIKNGGFEEGVQGTLPAGCSIEKENGAAGTVAIDNTRAHSGKQSILVHMTSASGYLHPSLSTVLKPGVYIFRVWARADPEQSFRMQIYDARAWMPKRPAALQLNGKGILSKEYCANNREWSKFEIEVDVTEEFSASIQIGLARPGNLWLDDIEIVQVKRATNVVGIKQTEQNLEIQNGKIVLNIAKGNQGAVLSYMMDGRLCRAASLNALQQDNAAAVNSFKVVKDTPELAVVEVGYSFADGLSASVTCSVKGSFEYVEIESDFADGKSSIGATIKSEAMLIPDFLADSIVRYPATAGGAKFNIPSDNFILVNMIDGGDAMLVLLWDSPQLSISESPNAENFNSVRLSAGVKAKFFMGIVAAKGIWCKTTEKLNSGEFTELNWKPPFPAEWKVTTFLGKGFHTDKSTCESWTFAQRETKESRKPWVPLENGVGITQPAAWQAWASGLGGFIYPCYFMDGKAFAKKPIFNNLKIVFEDSPWLIYALNGNDKTTAGVTMPKNALKKMLSKEMSNSIEAMPSPKNKYPATCGTTEKVEKVFYRSESVKEKKQIISNFDNMNMFVLVIRERIEEYVAWQQKMQKMFEEKKRLNAQLNPVIHELEKELAQIPWAYAKAKDNMKTPPYCTTLTEKVIALIDSKLSDEEKEEQCKALGRLIRTIGGSQDTLLGEYRSIVKACRQYATVKLMTSSSVEERELLKNVRTETGVMLNGRLGMEGK